MSIKKRFKYCLIKTGLFPFVEAALFLRRCSIFNTIYYNFKLFSFKEAVILPLAVGKNVKIVNKGEFLINCKLSPLMVICGVVTIPPFEDYKSKTIITNYGTVLINNKVNIHPGAKIWVAKNASLILEGYNIIGAESKVACHNEIRIGKYSGFSWCCEVFDTDFHYTKDITTGKIYNKDKPVFIGDNVFIGNHVNISKGTKLPNGAVVSSWSNVSGSFMKKGDYPLIKSPNAEMVDSGYYIAHGYKYPVDLKFGEEYKKLHNK